MKMTKENTRDIGAEILEGIREIKKGVVGRVTTFPPVAETRIHSGSDDVNRPARHNDP
jgi:hypothetical protein